MSASVPKMLYVNLEKWVNKHYPNGIHLDDWDEFIEEADNVIFQVCDKIIVLVRQNLGLFRVNPAIKSIVFFSA